MKIRFDPTRILQKGDFNAAVENGELVLPAELEDIIRPKYPHALGSAERFATNFIQIQRALWRNMLGWTEVEYDRAADVLATILRGHVPDALLDREHRVIPSVSGSLNPRLRQPSGTGEEKE